MAGFNWRLPRSRRRDQPAHEKDDSASVDGTCYRLHALSQWKLVATHLESIAIWSERSAEDFEQKARRASTPLAEEKMLWGADRDREIACWACAELAFLAAERSPERRDTRDPGWGAKMLLERAGGAKPDRDVLWRARYSHRGQLDLERGVLTDAPSGNGVLGG